jgi:hypothetical protein
MKGKNILLGGLIMTALSAFAQQNLPIAQVPTIVTSTLLQFYPNATNIVWQDDQGYYTAAFQNNNAATKLLLDLKGNLVQTSVHISSSVLPASATQYISVNYSGHTVTDAEKLTTFNHSTRYEAVVDGKDLVFDGSGGFLRIVSGPLKQ